MRSGRVSIEGIIYLTIGVAAAAAALVMLAVQDTYQAVARVKVSHPDYFIQTEFEVIRAEPVVGKVADALALARNWKIKQAASAGLTHEQRVNALNRQLDLRIVANTDLIEVRAFSDEPAEAALIANSVTDAFLDYKRRQNREFRIEQEKTQPALPAWSTEIADPMVEIVDCAVSPTRPIRPNRPLGATVFLLGALFVVVGFYAITQERAIRSAYT